MTDEASGRDGDSATLYISQRLRVSLPEHSTSHMHMMPECSGKLTLNDLHI